MRFTVTWENEANADLADRWLSLTPHAREHLRQCSDHIDAALRVNAHQKGSLLKGKEPLRFYSAPLVQGLPPIGVVYQVHVDDRLVRVLELWVLPKDWDASPHGGKPK